MLKHQLYPLIEKYIKEYLHGFTKKQLEIAITKGELKLQYLNIRPDTINKTMDEKNIPFWLKAGLIKKINIGCSVMNIIGEIPLELKIDGIDIILNPSYKWILKNIDYYKKCEIESKFLGDFFNLNIKNPLEIDFKKKTEDFDISIFKQIKELFKDKTIISNIINQFYEKCYLFYFQKNIPMSIKLKNIHIRFEDDFFINYNGNIALGIRIDDIDIKFGKKGNMKKNSIIITKLDIYWENQAKILIPSYFLYSLYIDGQLQESYYSQLQDIKFQNFNYQRNTKFIIENFNSTINFGTKIVNTTKNIDIFNIKDKPYILYIQISTNDININIWPELISILNNYNKFIDKFKIIEKIKEFKPKVKPYNIKEKNNNLNIDKDKSINRRLIVRNWFYYFLFCQKMQKYISSKNKNPLRVEFLRFFNIFCKRVDFTDKLEKSEINKENKDNKDINTNINFNNDLPIKILQNENNLDSNIIKNNKKNSFDFFSLGNIKNNLKNNKSIINNKSVININSYLNEQKRKQFEENKKLKQINLSFITDILIKSINININPSLNKDNINYLKLKIRDIQIKILLSKEKFHLNILTNTIDFNPYNLIYGERELLSEDSYRKLYQYPQNNNEYDTIRNLNPYYFNTENNNNYNTHNIMNNSNIYNGQGNEIKIRNDNLSIPEINNKKSRGSSFESRFKNNIDNSNNNINNNIVNKGINNRPLNTISNNYYPNDYYNNFNNTIRNININNNNQQINNRYYSIDNNNLYNNTSSFIKCTIARKTDTSNLEKENRSSNKNKLSKKQKKELDISRAVNNYNSYKIKQRSITPSTLIRSKKKKIINNKNIKEPFSNKNIPLNLLEIYSNSDNNNSFNLSFIKYNNPVSIDTFEIKLGTIRTNLFINYLLDCLEIFKEYNNLLSYEAINNFLAILFESKNMEHQKQLYHLKEYFYKKITRLPDNQKTESIIKYEEYLRKEIFLIKIFNSKIEEFQLNYLFSIFNNGIKLNLGFENLECVYYSKFKKISGKFILPANEFEIIISLKKINIKIFGMELEINDLEDTKLILKKIKQIFENKLIVAKIMIEPCYIELKKELLDKDSEESKNYDNNKNEDNEKGNKQFTNINTNDEIKNIIINSNNKIFFDDNNILVNSYNKNINEEEKK